MKEFKIAILGCGTVGGGVAKILTEIKEDLMDRSGVEIKLDRIVEIKAADAAKRFGLAKELFCGGGRDLTKDEAAGHIDDILKKNEIDLVVETIGGTGDFLYNLMLDVLNSGKHLVTANKAMLAERGKELFKAAAANNVILSYEAAVCGAIPIIKSIKDSFAGDDIQSLSGIMNGTSNYILTKMQEEGLDFEEALKLAQEMGYAEADPSLDINGGDAGHKLTILIKLAFGMEIDFDKLSIQGIENITIEDLMFAGEMGCNIKLIGFAEKRENKIYTAIHPMMVKKENMLSKVGGATNAVQLVNKYSGQHMLMGAGAGSSETASSIVADIVFTARYADQMKEGSGDKAYTLLDLKEFTLPYCIIFTTDDVPGITGTITTAIGNQNINIDTVGHNRHNGGGKKAIFPIATMACTYQQIENAVKEIKEKRPDILLKDPKIIPILY